MKLRIKKAVSLAHNQNFRQRVNLDEAQEIQRYEDANWQYSTLTIEK